MKNQTLIVIIAILVIALAFQSYTVYRLNDTVNRLTGHDLEGTGPNLELPKPLQPRPGFRNDPFSGQWNPYEEMERMQKEMERIFEDSISRFQMNTPSGRFGKAPEVDLRETRDSYVVTANVPGADDSTLDVRLEDNILSISVKTEKSAEASDSRDQYRRRERFVGEFRRSMTLPGPVDDAHMKTGYRNGVLTITIPKR
ncbi:MAG: Hsp20/alpha crystallin family protein [Gammaproteobacteria bacterium]